MLTTAFYLIGAHWVADYPGQGILAQFKQEGPLRVYHLIAHAGIHGAAVTLVTGSLVLGFIEWALHTVIDETKTRGKICFAQDQAAHLICKAGYLAALGFGVA